MYSSKLLEHFQNSRFAGRIPEANSTVRMENPVCGDILELQALMKKDQIETIRFRAKGCVPSMACGSALCHLVEGRTRSDALRLTRDDVVQELGGVPQASMHAVQLALDALKKLLA